MRDRVHNETNKRQIILGKPQSARCPEKSFKLYLLKFTEMTCSNNKTQTLNILGTTGAIISHWNKYYWELFSSGLFKYTGKDSDSNT